MTLVGLATQRNQCRGEAMLIHFLPNQVAEHWDLLEFAIEQALPPMADDSPDKMNNILESMLIGKLQCWISVNEDKLPEAVITTMILNDYASKTKTLLIYSAYAFDKTAALSWMEGFDTLFKYGKSKGCSAVTAFSNENKIINIAQKFGADISVRYLSFQI